MQPTASVLASGTAGPLWGPAVCWEEGTFGPHKVGDKEGFALGRYAAFTQHAGQEGKAAGQEPRMATTEALEGPLAARS